MTLQQLRYIVAIDTYKHFGKAAEACSLTQSTLSLMVKKLEEELDIQIFDRDSHPVAATEVGRKVIDQAKVVLYNAEQISAITKSEKEMLSGPLKVALISTVTPVLVPGMFKYFGKNYPSIALHTEEMLSDTIKSKLKKAEVDIGIMAGPVDEDYLLEIPLYHENFLAYVSPDNPAYKQDSIRKDTILDQMVWIIRDGLRQLSPAEMSDGRFSYERFFEGGRVGILVQVVKDNGGLTIIPETHRNLLSPEDKKSLRPIIDPVPGRTISLVIRKDYIHELKLNALADTIRYIIPEPMLDGMIRGGNIHI